MFILDPFQIKLLRTFSIKNLIFEPVCNTAIKCKARRTLPYLGKPPEVFRLKFKNLFKKCLAIIFKQFLQQTPESVIYLDLKTNFLVS